IVVAPTSLFPAGVVVSARIRSFCVVLVFALVRFDGVVVVAGGADVVVGYWC
ncbi:hypothetical protein A2U01_0101748, partial [Trifolium medium]|nr:hypothetical protein [Trifolium medium]